MMYPLNMSDYLIILSGIITLYSFCFLGDPVAKSAPLQGSYPLICATRSYVTDYINISEIAQKQENKKTVSEKDALQQECKSIFLDFLCGNDKKLKEKAD